MKQFLILKRCSLISAAAFIFLLFSAQGLAKAVDSAVEHRLEITLLPDGQKLIGRDLIRVQAGDSGEISFHLSNRARVQALTVNGRARPFRFQSSDLIVPLGAREHGRRVEVDIRYEAIFNDPVPANPLNTDNPGFGVTASISGKGVFLLAGSGWYPEIGHVRSIYTLRVQAPAGMVAVTAGRSLGHQTFGGITTCDWLIEHPVEGLSLSAAVYEAQEQRAGDVLISLYLFPEDRDLAPAYLRAAADYIRFYSDLFGPYPFPKFAVVENFFPTGYGFPSCTLIGGSVLRLP